MTEITKDLSPINNARFELWDSNVPYPQNDQITTLSNVKFSSISLLGNYAFAHGVAIFQFKEKLFSSFGRNPTSENSVGEEAVCYISNDMGKTWTYHSTIGEPVTGGGRSHGVFAEKNGTLWAFHAVYLADDPGTSFPHLRMEALTLNESTNQWESRATIADNFWPLREPVKLANGNWFIAGVNKYFKAAVAISHGDDLTTWDVKFPPIGDNNYTESSAWVNGNRITLVIRNHSPIDEGKYYIAISVSEDYGVTWSHAVETNMPANTSKPYAGYLSTGQKYFLSNSANSAIDNREQLTISVGSPGSEQLSKVFLIRGTVVPQELISLYETTLQCQVSYPHAIEMDGCLYVVYSSSTTCVNANNIELAVFPISDLTTGV